MNKDRGHTWTTVIFAIIFQIQVHCTCVQRLHKIYGISSLHRRTQMFSSLWVGRNVLLLILAEILTLPVGKYVCMCCLKKTVLHLTYLSIRTASRLRKMMSSVYTCIYLLWAQHHSTAIFFFGYLKFSLLGITQLLLSLFTIYSFISNFSWSCYFIA